MNKLTKEQVFFIDVINNTERYLSINYNKEYKKYESIESKHGISQFDIIIFQKYLEHHNLKEFLINEIKNINVSVLYKSKFHGISHNIKTLIYALIICTMKGLDYYYYKTRIILDACKYHDIGRKNDREDRHHGERSSNKIDEVVKNDEFYQNKNYLNLLKASMDIHSKNDIEERNIAAKYQVDIEEFKSIYSILKDVDALDRIRLSMRIPLLKELDTNYLRTKESKALVKFASQLNTIYYLVFLHKIDMKMASRIK